MLLLKEICKWTDGEFIPGKDGAESIDFETFKISGICRDSRKLMPGGSLFVALKGGNYDAHDFLIEAEKNGAAVCIVERVCADISIPQIKVKDTLKALQKIAAAYREGLNIPVVGITGSNGKTTTKNFCAAVLAKKYKVAYTQGNLNNHIGLAVSVLSIKPDDEIAVLELGMSSSGEIKFLAGVCKPTAGVITNIGSAHIEFFGSKVAIAKERGELAAALPDDSEGGFLVIPKNEEYAKDISEMTKARIVAVDESDTVFGPIALKLRNGGIQAKHVLMSALLAAAVGKEYGISDDDIVEALLSAANDRGRFAVRQIKIINTHLAAKAKEPIFDIVDDTYNANPDSVCASIDAVADMYPDRIKILALGRLMEQGTFEEDGYKRIIEKAGERGFTKILFVGIPYLYAGTIQVKNQQECAELLVQEYDSKQIVLFKGSRGSKMEDAISALENMAK